MHRDPHGGPVRDDDYPHLVLRRGEERRLRAGHLWVFSNEVDVARTPLASFTPGQRAWIVDAAGKPLGTGYVNPNTLICARLVDRAGHALDRELIAMRLRSALALRERLYPEPYYRLLFGESDGLPGLTVDRFGDVLVAQATTAGMEALRDEATGALLQVLSPRVLVWKNDSSARSMEGLGDSVQVVHGTLDGPTITREGGVEFGCDLLEGQKTGWFHDQRANRDRLAPYVRGQRVLDVFSYLGGWGLRAAAFGAAEVDCVDVSTRAVEGIRANIARNGMASRVQAHAADAFDFLKAVRHERRRWDVVVLDPPAFVKRKKDFKEGALAYRRIAEAAMQVLEPGGILIECSCSHHMPRAELLAGMQAAAVHQGRFLQVLEPLSQSPDHPVHPAIPETDYLKGYATRVLPA
jgi:23S rRNA (cytosine1962-C5)-methyltransferase